MEVPSSSTSTVLWLEHFQFSHETFVVTTSRGPSTVDLRKLRYARKYYRDCLGIATYISSIPTNTSKIYSLKFEDTPKPSVM